MRNFKKPEVVMRITLFFIISVILIFSFQVTIFQIGRNLNLNPSIIENLVRSVNGIVGMGLVYIFLKFDRLNFDLIGLKWDEKYGQTLFPESIIILNYRSIEYGSNKGKRSQNF